MKLEELQVFGEEIAKVAFLKEALPSPTKAIGGFLKRQGGRVGAVGHHLERQHSAYDLGGLGVLAANPAEDLLHEAKRKREGKKVDRKEVRRGATELAGLGILAAPSLAAVLSKKH